MNNIENNFSIHLKEFQKLMRIKVRDILLISSQYDYYLFEEDGRLYDLIRQEYQDLNLSHAPEITHVTTAAEATELASTNNFDLIITTIHIEDMHVIRFAKMIRESGINTPIILLAYDNREHKDLITNYDTSIFSKIFIWQGDYRLLIGIIKYIEDKLNVEEDTKNVGVQSILLVEDNVKFYSAYLPLIYTEVFKQSQRLISEGVSLTHRFLRMRARPKILLTTTYEEAMYYYKKFEDNILGIISDINFKRNGEKDPEAGLKFAEEVKSKHYDIPILLQSSNPNYSEKAHKIGAAFLLKGSPWLLNELRDFMLKNFGFGDFVFQTPKGEVVGKAHNLFALEEQLRIVPDESIVYHASRNHFSKWLKARTEFWLAHRLRPQKVTDFESVSALRQNLINAFKDYQKLRQRGIITDFSKESFDPKDSFARIGSGSLGGKARGLGFVNSLINNLNIRNKFPGIEISVPSAVVIATDVFDHFIEENNLKSIIFSEISDEELTKIFLKATYFPADVKNKLAEFLEIMKGPLAVRSSSVLEDSQFQPFAGVYQTYMIPNINQDKEVRLNELLACIKCVYASTFFQKAKYYMKATSYRLEEEKMAVIIQRLVGSQFGELFYPNFAGVAKSYNFYPIAPQKSSDGIALVALGLGKQVVDGGNSVRFCPKYPKHLLQFYSTKETIKTAQQDFFALNLNISTNLDDLSSFENFIQKVDLSKAEKDSTLSYVGSTYSPENEAIYDGISRKGIRFVTFAPILKNNLFPLAEILDLICEKGSWGMGTHVEIEFAVNINTPAGEPQEFAILQMRPMVISHELEEVDFKDVKKEDIICQSYNVLGNGVIEGIYDIVVIDYYNFDRSKSKEAAFEVSLLNSKLLKQKTPYILIGVGRWGSADPWLGIPVSWDQISAASVIVEAGFKDFYVTPSQGSHFFQNITSFKIGYFTVNSSDTSMEFIDWDWLLNQPPEEKLNYIRHLKFEKPLSVKINGHKNIGIIKKPDNIIY